MNTILQLFVEILVFLHIIAPVATPLPVSIETPIATPIVSQTVQKPTPVPVVSPKTDSLQISKCKLEASLIVDKLSDTFIKSNEFALVNNPLYTQRQLILKAKSEPLKAYEMSALTNAHYRNIASQRNSVEIDALYKIMSEQLINSQKELGDSFKLLTDRQYNLTYLQCVNR